jgi:hypothetical protein
MKPAAIFKFIFKLLLLEAFIILVIDAIVLAFMNEFGQGIVLLPIGTLLYFLMTAPFAMLIYILSGMNTDTAIKSCYTPHTFCFSLACC